MIFEYIKKQLCIFLFSYGIPIKLMHSVLTPIRMYYLIMRWIFGNEYNPFETNIQECFHPIILFLFDIKVDVILVNVTPENILLAIFFICILRFFSKYSFE